MTPLRGRWAAVRRVLAVRLAGTADVLMTTPALRALASARPRIELALLTSPAGEAVARLLPEVDEVLTADPERLADADASTLVDVLARGAFDGAVIFETDAERASAIARACRLAGIPLLIGHAAGSHEAARPRHEVRRALELVAALDARIDDVHESLRVPPEAARWIRARLTEAGVGRDRPWALIDAGAGARSGAAEPLAAAARLLATDHGWRVVLAGGTGDSAEAASGAMVRDLPPGAATSLAGELDLPRLAALVAYAPVVIAAGPDVAHLAAAVATPVVTVVPGMTADRTPWAVPSRLLDDAAQPDEIVAATLELAAGVSGLVHPAATPAPLAAVAGTR